MILRHFLCWAQTASAARRAEAADALARAYLHADLDPAQRREAEIALTSLADDPSPLVRRARSSRPWPATSPRSQAPSCRARPC